MFALLEGNPDRPVSVGLRSLNSFIEDVRDVVKTYYGSQGAVFSSRAVTYTLQYSSLYSWDSATMYNYNCYAYALGLTNGIYEPGDFSGQTYSDASSIATVAEQIKDDLNLGFGYNCVKVQSNRPTSNVGWANVIAVRKDTTYDFMGRNDFHVAKLTYAGWLHKTGRFAVLKFNSAPTNSIIWTNEGYDGTYFEPTVTYDSEIRYLLYKANHGNTTYTWTGEHYHSGSTHYYLYAYVCNDCGNTVSHVWATTDCDGPPCTTPWRLLHETESA